MEDCSDIKVKERGQGVKTIRILHVVCKINAEVLPEQVVMERVISDEQGRFQLREVMWIKFSL